MSSIDRSKPVMVTGATGYVAGWLVKKLLEEGYTVHAAVRNPDNKAKTAHLDAIAEQAPGSIRYFASDLLKPGSYADAMQGCSVVFHTASPFTSNFKDPQKDLIDPAVKGTANVLESASQTPSVQRVVLTSSCAAIYTDAIDTTRAPGGAITEEIWNSTASLDYQPYSYSKTMAEKKAWELAEAQDQWDLVVVNPSFVMGPPLNTKSNTSESFSILKQMGDGTFRMGAPKMGFGVVDVRDVAEAHYRAAFTPSAKGRYITSAHNTDLFAMTQALRPKFGADYPLPKSPAPKWLLMLVGPMVNKMMTRQVIRNNVNVPFRADNSKIKKELGMDFRPLQQTMEDAFQVLVDEKVL
jgi:nucleoside-diphosphate-sugar epimerase